MATITTEFGKLSSKKQRAVYLLVRDKKTVKRIITVQTLEGEINRKLDEMHKEYPDDYNRRKRPDVFEEKK